MAGTTSSNAAGFDRIQYAVSSSGIPTDYASLAGDDSPLGLTRLFAAQAADVSVPEPTVVPIPGDDGIDAQFQFDVTELEDFTMSVGRSNNAFVNTIQGSSAIDMQSTLEMLGRNPKGRDFTDIFFLMSRRAQKRNGTTGGGYEHVVVPNATGTYLGSGFETQGAGVYNYKITANYVDQTFWGNALGDGTNEVGGKSQFSSFEFTTDNQVVIDVYRSDGTATTFTPTQTPRTGGLILAWDAGDLVLGTVPSTLAVTLSSGDFSFTAPDSDDYIIVLYEVA